MLQAPTLVITTAPWLVNMPVERMNLQLRDQLNNMRQYRQIQMVRKYRDSAGKHRVVRG